MRLMQLQFLESRYSDKQVKETLCDTYKVIHYLKDVNPLFSDIIRNLPQKSAYLIFQINQSCDEVYVGFCKMGAGEKKPMYSVLTASFYPLHN